MLSEQGGGQGEGIPHHTKRGALLRLHRGQGINAVARSGGGTYTRDGGQQGVVIHHRGCARGRGIGQRHRNVHLGDHIGLLRPGVQVVPHGIGQHADGPHVAGGIGGGDDVHGLRCQRMCRVINQMAMPHDMWRGAQQFLAVGDLA